MAEDILNKALQQYTVDLINLNKGSFNYICDVCKNEQTCCIASIKHEDKEYPLALNYNKFILPNIPMLVEHNKYFLKSDIWICCDECNKNIKLFVESLSLDKLKLKN